MFRLFYDSSISDFTSVLSQETDSKMTTSFVIQEATSRLSIGLVSERWGRWGVIWARVNHEREILLHCNTEPIVAQEMHIRLTRIVHQIKK